MDIRLTDDRTLQSVTLKKLTTDKNNLLVRMLYVEGGKNLSFYFYMDPEGERLIAEYELKMAELNKPPFLTYKEWDWAERTWGSNKARLSEVEMKSALKLIPLIMENPLYNFPADVIKKPEKEKVKAVKKTASTGKGDKVVGLNNLPAAKMDDAYYKNFETDVRNNMKPGDTFEMNVTKQFVEADAQA